MNYPLAILGLGPTEILVVVLALLILFGAGRLPQIGSSLGKSLKNFRKGLKGESEEEKSPPKDDENTPVPPKSLS